MPEAELVLHALHKAEIVVLGGEEVGAHQRQARIVKSALEGSRGEVREVARHVEVEPTRAAPARFPAPEVGHGHQQYPARLQDPADFLEHGPWSVHGFQHMPEDHQIELTVGEIAILERVSADRQAQSVPGIGGGLLTQFRALRLPASLAQLLQQQTPPAAYVEHFARLLLTLDLQGPVTVQMVEEP